MKLCSACLLGIKCRYDGQSRPNSKVLALAKKEALIPVCPEQLGGLATPRIPQEKVGKRILNKVGEDVTDNFNRGAEEVLKLAKLLGIKEAIFKQKSPSCGCGLIYDGTFSGNVIKGDGFTTELLKKNGIKVISDEEL